MKKENKKKEKQTKLKYEKPQLIKHGDIRDVTMGGSPGSGDSGNAFTEQTF
ncbi:MAG: lasso RiPP family leader peptide-containing protein [Proteobacteria bacterium]|nr:lasso RiPP family leader peptide-containing protein [Pseudomonadota bacterium]